VEQTAFKTKMYSSASTPLRISKCSDIPIYLFIITLSRREKQIIKNSRSVRIEGRFCVERYFE
jgi:hypothetical protein